MMKIFQAITHKNNIIENIAEGKKPSTLEGAAQAWVKDFNADYSRFSSINMTESWIEQTTIMLMENYDVSREIAFEEAVERFNQAMSS